MAFIPEISEGRSHTTDLQCVVKTNELTTLALQLSYSEVSVFMDYSRWSPGGLTNHRSPALPSGQSKHTYSSLQFPTLFQTPSYNHTKAFQRGSGRCLLFTSPASAQSRCHPQLLISYFYIACAKTNQQPQKASELTFVWLAGSKGDRLQELPLQTPIHSLPFCTSYSIIYYIITIWSFYFAII